MIKKKITNLLLVLIALLAIPSLSLAYTLTVNPGLDYPIQSNDDYQVIFSADMNTSRHKIPTFNLNKTEHLVAIISEKNYRDNIHLQTVNYYLVDANTGANALASQSAIRKNNKFYIEINPNILNKNKEYKLKVSLHYTSTDKIYTKIHEIAYLEAYDENENIDNDDNSDNDNTINHAQIDNYYVKYLSPEADYSSVRYFSTYIYYDDKTDSLKNGVWNNELTVSIKQRDENGPEITQIDFYLDDILYNKWQSPKVSRIAQMNSVYSKLYLDSDFNILDAVETIHITDPIRLALKMDIHYKYADGYTYVKTNTLAYYEYLDILGDNFGDDSNDNDNNDNNDNNNNEIEKIYDAEYTSNIDNLVDYNGNFNLANLDSDLNIDVYDSEPNNEAEIIDVDAFLIPNYSVSNRIYLDKIKHYDYYSFRLSQHEFSLFSNDTFTLYLDVKYAIDDYEYEERIQLYNLTYENYNNEYNNDDNNSVDVDSDNTIDNNNPSPENDLILSLNQFAIIRSSSSAMYLINKYNHRFYIPDWSVLKSWYYNPVIIQVNDAQLSQYQLIGNLIYRPGSLVKIETDPKCYAVDANGVLRWVINEDVARAIYGPNWNKNIYIVPDALFPSYSIGDPIYSSSDFDMPSLEEAIQMYNK